MTPFAHHIKEYKKHLLEKSIKCNGKDLLKRNQELIRKFNKRYSS